MNTTQREAVREMCAALNAALIDHHRDQEQARRDRYRATVDKRTDTHGKRSDVIPMPQVQVKLTDDEILEDVEWLLSTREHPPRIAKRVGKTPGALARWLHRKGRHDLAAPFERKTAEAVA